MDPDVWGWDMRAWMLADIFDQLSAANWQRGGGREHNRPQPRPRPQTGEETINPDVHESGRYVGEAVPVDDINAWLGWA